MSDSQILVLNSIQTKYVIVERLWSWLGNIASAVMLVCTCCAKLYLQYMKHDYCEKTQGVQQRIFKLILNSLVTFVIIHPFNQ